MNEPMTLFDYGMYQLSESLKNKAFIFLTLDEKTNKHELKNIMIDTSVYYSWDENKIIINATPDYYNHASDYKTAKEWCNQMIDKIRTELGIDQDNPASGSFARLELFFSHDGFKKKAEPKNLVKELVSIMEINTSVLYREKDKDKSKKIKCKTSFIGKDVFYSE
jgi:hypothetical protein